MTPTITIYRTQTGRNNYSAHINKDGIVLLKLSEIVFDKRNLIIRSPIFSDNNIYKINIKEDGGGRFNFSHALQESDLDGRYLIEKEDDDYVLVKTERSMPTYINISKKDNNPNRNSYRANFHESTMKFINSNTVVFDVINMTLHIPSTKHEKIYTIYNYKNNNYLAFNYKGNPSDVIGLYLVEKGNEGFALIRQMEWTNKG